ncbi:MAG: hypothetical protein ACK4WA_08765 [Chitinophagales bacterium]
MKNIKQKMKYRLILFLIVLSEVVISDLSAQNRRSGKPLSALTKVDSAVSERKKDEEELKKSTDLSHSFQTRASRWNFSIETGIIPVASENYQKLNCYQGLLSLGYKLFGELEIGLFGQTLFYYQNLEATQLDNKIIDMGSMDYHTFGLSLAYDIPIKKLWLSPKLDIGYNIWNAKAIDYAQDNKAFLDYRYLSVCPKLRLGYSFNESLSLGVYGGYNMQLTALKGSKTEIFNPTSYVLGLTTKIRIMK